MDPDQHDAAAGDRSGEPSSVLVLGFGNTLRRDDGVGAVAAERMARDPRFAGSDVEVRAAYQLLPEMALDIAECTLVVFVDADLRGLPGTIEVRPVTRDAPRSDADARAEPGASSHHVGAGQLLALGEQLTGQRPEAVAVSIGIADLEVGEGLSPAVASALPRVIDVVWRLLEEHRP